MKSSIEIKTQIYEFYLSSWRHLDKYPDLPDHIRVKGLPGWPEDALQQALPNYRIDLHSVCPEMKDFTFSGCLGDDWKECFFYDWRDVEERYKKECMGYGLWKED